MKVLMIIAVTFTLMVNIDCGHVKGKHQKGSKKKAIVRRTRQGDKRQLYPDSFMDPFCCQGPYPPPCCDHTALPPPPLDYPYQMPDMVPPIPPCCQSLPPHPCCSLGPDHMMPYPGCCGAVQPNPHPCCMNLGLNTGEEKKIPVSQNGQHLVLHLKLKHKPTKNGGENRENALTDCQRAALKMHNKKRKIHNSQPMSLDLELNDKAKRYADRLKNQRESGNDVDDEEPNGMNVGKICKDKYFEKEVICKKIVKEWYNEVKYFNFKSPRYSKETKHFTQVVWRSSTKLGIGFSSYDKSGKTCYVLVGQYEEPAGKDAQQIKTNVKKGNYKSFWYKMVKKIGRKVIGKR